MASKIKVERNADDARLEELGVRKWPIWTKEASEFPWRYDEAEVCYILEGEIEVTPDGDEPVRIGPGDLVTFPKGMGCRWKVTKPVRKHYTWWER